MTDFTPLDLLRNNAKSQRAAAIAHRADAARSMVRAIEEDEKAELWEAAAKVLETFS